jgi:exodeoxyribonuclease V gamma subunit
MKVYRSNRVEQILQALVEVVQQPTADPLQPQQVVVQSRGMAVWLSMRLAQRFGVWAGDAFPFPRRFIHGLFETVLGEPVANMEAFGRERMLWAILAELPRLLPQEPFADLARFCSDDPQGRNRFGLAQRIADVFDQYLVFRPEMILGWERGQIGSDAEQWQALLWQALAARHGKGHVAGLAQGFLATLAGPDFDASRLPPRICVFGLSTLPPLYIQLLAGVGQHVDVHLFVVSPSREYWVEIRSHYESLRASRRNGAAVELDTDAPPLLASLGTVGRDFQGVLESSVDYEDPAPDRYIDPGVDNMLHALQSDILRLQRPAEPHIIDSDDRSIAVHACHSPMREVEVLHDQILGLLAADATLEPTDIVVMMSDVERYAPLVEAVFERDRTDPTHVPYCIADRSVRGESPVVEALHRIVALSDARVTASEVLDLLALDPVAARFDISPEDVDTVTGWIGGSGIRWGVDAAHRKSHGQPKLSENTWRFGLDRMLLGYALPGSGRETFAGVLPYDELEGQSTELLGRLATFSDRLFELLKRLRDPRTLRGWQETLTALLDSMLASPVGGSWELGQVRVGLDAMAREAEAAGFTDTVPAAAVIDVLTRSIEGEQPARGFLAGGVTFCAMLPMRSVPFRVVCILGLSDNDFPRAARPVGFDLMARAPRPGDRSRRADDRYLFLEALLAARDRVQLYYVGQSIQDNSELPPSVVVSELLDALADDCVVPPGQVVLRHPMQPFSPRYFGADDDPRLFSFAKAYRDGADALQQGPTAGERAPLLSAPLPVLQDGGRPRELPLGRLLQFYRLPAAELLKRRLGVNLDDWSRDRSDREPMELTGLEAWKVGTAVLEHKLEAMPESRSLELLRAGGELPLGVPGGCRYDQIARIVDPMALAAESWRAGERLPPLDVDLEMTGGLRLTGVLGSRWPLAMASHQYARLGAKHLLAAWIRHLVLCACTPRDQPTHTVIVARGDQGPTARVGEFRSVEDPRRHLTELVELYFVGQCEPLLLFPGASLAYCQALARKPDPDAALDVARAEWTKRAGGEAGDPHIARLFGDLDALAPGFSLFDQPMRGGDFPQLAVRVFGPLLQHLSES